MKNKTKMEDNNNSQPQDLRYNAGNGMSRVVLSRYSTFGSQVQQSNTIYVIQYDFDLLQDTVTLYSGCILEFQGGRVKNGSIVFNNTYVNFGREYGAFQNCTFSGTITNRTLFVDNFGASPSNTAYINTTILNNIFTLGKTNPHVFLFGKGVYKIYGSLKLDFGYDNRCEVAGFDSDMCCILQMTNDTPILIGYEYANIHDLNLKYYYIQSEYHSNSIAIAARRLLMAEIYNMTIENAAVVLGGLDAEEGGITDLAFVNINVRNIHALGVSRYFYCGQTPTGGSFGNSGSTFDNIRMTITPRDYGNTSSCLGFSKLPTNSNFARIGELNIESGVIEGEVFGLGILSSLSVDYLHFENVTFNDYLFVTRDGTSLSIDTVDFDYTIRFKCYISILSLIGESSICIRNIQFHEGNYAPEVLEDPTTHNQEVFLFNPENGNDGICSVEMVSNIPDDIHYINANSPYGSNYILSGKPFVLGKVKITAQKARKLMRIPQMTYIITEDIDLAGETFVMPANCTMIFAGGKISNSSNTNASFNPNGARLLPDRDCIASNINITGYFAVGTIRYQNGIPEYWDGSGWTRMQGQRKGPSASRPQALGSADAGMQYFDTTIGKPVFWNGSNWVDSSGVVS